MIRNWLLTAIRSFRKNKTASAMEYRFDGGGETQRGNYPSTVWKWKELLP